MGASEPFRIRLTPQNFEFLRRLDEDKSGHVTHFERGWQERKRKMDGWRQDNEFRGLNVPDRAAWDHFRGSLGSDLVIEFCDLPVGSEPDATSWDEAHEYLAADMAEETAAPGTWGQEMPGNLKNGYCGAASALFILDRHGGLPKGLTHAQIDQRLVAMGVQSPDIGQQVALMNRHASGAGDARYRYETLDVKGEPRAFALRQSIAAGLASDPAGVVVPILASNSGTDATGTNHWIVVTGVRQVDGSFVVDYYDPGGPDGAKHQCQMPLDELSDSLIPQTSSSIRNGKREAAGAFEIIVGRRLR